MGSDLEECWCRMLRFNWFGHQSWFDVPLPAICLLDRPVTGHFILSLILSPSYAIWSCSYFIRRHYGFPWSLHTTTGQLKSRFQNIILFWVDGICLRLWSLFLCRRHRCSMNVILSFFKKFVVDLSKRLLFHLDLPRTTTGEGFLLSVHGSWFMVHALHCVWLRIKRDNSNQFSM